MSEDVTEGAAGIADDAPAAEDKADETQPGIADDLQPEGGEDQKREDRPAEEGTGDKKPEPEAYELTAGEDFPMPDETLKEFTKTCRDAGLTKEQAEAVLGWHKSQYQDYQAQNAQSVKDTLAGWGKEIQADKEFGGARWKDTLMDARKALEVADPDGALRTMLRETQYQHNPAIIRAVARIGRLMREHDFIGGNGEGKRAAPLEERFWPGGGE